MKTKRQNRRIQIGALALLSTTMMLGLAGCGTEPLAPGQTAAPIDRAPVLPVPGSRTGTGAVLMVADFQGLAADSDMSCRWRMINQETKESFFIDIKPGTANAFARLAPVKYKSGRFGCGITHVWDIDNAFKDGFTVESNNVSYLGKLTFVFSNDDLSEVKQAPRAESAAAFASAVDQTGAKDMTVISAFTEKPIDRTMVQGKDLLDSFDVFGKGVDNPTKSLSPLLTNLQKCSKTEAATDPVRFGQLQYVAIYKEGRFSEMKDRQDANGFSDRLRSCVERGMMAYHPVQKKDVEVRVRY